MKLYKNGGIEGYEINEVSNYMKKLGLLRRWNKWYMGSTGGIIDGKFIVYKWDFESFLEGRPNLD
jgi:hypothetical protein